MQNVTSLGAAAIAKADSEAATSEMRTRVSGDTRLRTMPTGMEPKPYTRVAAVKAAPSVA